jgi:hypothetical protein
MLLKSTTTSSPPGPRRTAIGEASRVWRGSSPSPLKPSSPVPSAVHSAWGPQGSQADRQISRARGAARSRYSGSTRAIREL